MNGRKTMAVLMGLLLCAVFLVLLSPETVQARLGDRPGLALAKTSVKKPVIGKQPEDETAAAGKTAVFTVEASGNNLQYQWYYQKPGSTVWTAVSSGGKTSEYRLVTEIRHDGYRYRCVISNSAGKVTSAEVKLTVLSKPAVTTQPKDVTKKAGTEAVFKIAATGGALKYQWFYRRPGTTEWTAVSVGGMASEYRLTIKTRHDGYQYRCVVKNAKGSVTSKTAVLTVLSKPAVTTQPKDVTVKAGSTAKFKIAASGGALKYQWYYKKPGSDSWTAVSASSGRTAVYSLSTQVKHNGYQYKCVVSNTLGKATSTVVKLTAVTAPVITEQPLPGLTWEGGTVRFEVKATGGGLSYQWYYRADGEETWNKCTASSARSAAYTLVAQMRHQEYQYRCVVKNLAGSAVSETVGLRLLTNTITDFEAGTVEMSSGREYALKNRARSVLYPLEAVIVTWKSGAPANYRLFYYDENFDLLSYSALRCTSQTLREGSVKGAKYFRVVLQPAVSGGTLDPDFALPEGCSILTAAGPVETFHDEPKNQGVVMLRKRAEQILNLTFTTMAVLPNQKGDIAEGTTVTGVTYSSTRKESLYVPQCVSFDTYMTALMNPNSYIYTRISTAPNSKTYYGSVCSAFISYCYGLKGVHTTADLPLLEDFSLAEYQDIEHLEVGDMLLCHNGTTNHTMFVYDITRNEEGRIINVIFAHQGTPTAYTYAVTPKGFTGFLGETRYQIYKFNHWDQLTYEESQWVSVSGEEEKDPQWNHYLGPRRGDKANWPQGEAVEIDILNKGDFTAARLYRGEELISETEIAEIDCLVYEDLDTGKYRVCLAAGSDCSEYCYFNVVSSEISVEDLGGGRAKICFHSDCGTPSWYAWCGSSGADRWGAFRAFDLTEEEIEDGCAISEYEAGTWMFKVEFTNEFGTFSSTFITADIS